MAETLGTKGAELNLLIRQGATLGPYYMYIKKQDTTAVNLTGATFRAQIRKTPDSFSLQGVVFAFEIIDAPNGQVKWSVPASSTELLIASEKSETEPSSTYVWDMEVELTDGRVLPLTYGTVNVFREVAKDEV